MASPQMLGYKDVRNLGSGLGTWKKANLLAETGKPVDPAAGKAPQVNQTMLLQLDAFLTALPEGFNTKKVADLNSALAETEKPFILDVRTAEELTKDGAIEGSVNIPINDLFARLGELPKDKAAKIVVLCKSGHRGALAMMALQMNGGRKR